MQECVADTSYLASPDFIATVLHILTTIEVPILCYGAICILFKTSPQMSSVKGLMLNLHVWSSLSDLLISFLGIPYILLPAPAGYGLGLIHSPAVMIYCCITLIAAVTVSVLAIYENRYYVLFGRNTRWKEVRKPFFILICSLVPLVFLPPLLSIPEQESARRFVLSTIPCQPPFTYNERELFVLAVDFAVPFACIACGTVILATLITVFFCLTFYHILRGKMLSLYSAKTCLMHRKFAIAVTFQSVFMLSVVLAPVVTVLVILNTRHHDQALNNFVFIVLSCHGVGSTIVMIIVHRPYRQFTLSILSFVLWGQKADTRSSQRNHFTAGVSVI